MSSNWIKGGVIAALIFGILGFIIAIVAIILVFTVNGNKGDTGARGPTGPTGPASNGNSGNSCSFKYENYITRTINNFDRRIDFTPSTLFTINSEGGSKDLVIRFSESISVSDGDTISIFNNNTDQHLNINTTNNSNNGIQGYPNGFRLLPLEAISLTYQTIGGSTLPFLVPSSTGTGNTLGGNESDCDKNKRKKCR